MRLVFRIFDFDNEKRQAAETAVNSLVRQYGFDADVYQVAEMLEVGRLGLSDGLPALEINDIIVSKGTPLTMDRLRLIFEKLYAFSLKK